MSDEKRFKATEEQEQSMRGKEPTQKQIRFIRKLGYGGKIGDRLDAYLLIKKLLAQKKEREKKERTERPLEQGEFDFSEDYSSNSGYLH